MSEGDEIMVTSEEEMQAQGFVVVLNLGTKAVLGSACWRPEMGKWSFQCRAQRDLRKTSTLKIEGKVLP